MKSKNDYAADIRTVCRWVERLLIAKNRSYGNSVFESLGIFSKADALAAVNARLDDKLARIKSQDSTFQEDTELDLIGYLIIKRVIMMRKSRKRRTCPQARKGVSSRHA